MAGECRFFSRFRRNAYADDADCFCALVMQTKLPEYIYIQKDVDTSNNFVTSFYPALVGRRLIRRGESAPDSVEMETCGFCASSQNHVLWMLLFLYPKERNVQLKMPSRGQAPVEFRLIVCLRFHTASMSRFAKWCICCSRRFAYFICRRLLVQGSSRGVRPVWK